MTTKPSVADEAKERRPPRTSQIEGHAVVYVDAHDYAVIRKMAEARGNRPMYEVVGDMVQIYLRDLMSKK